MNGIIEEILEEDESDIKLKNIIDVYCGHNNDTNNESA